MGLRGELFSTRVILQNRTYFFNVKENRMGDLYLNIVESKNRETGGFDRQSVILFAEDLQEFLKGFDESLRILEKEVREKRRSTGRSVMRNTSVDTEKGGKLAGGKISGSKIAGGSSANGKPDFSDKPRKGRPPKDGKRVIVKKGRRD